MPGPPRRSRTRQVGLLALAVLLGVASAAAAEPDRRVVLLLANGDEARRETLVGAIRAQLGDLPVGIVVERAEGSTEKLRDRLDLAAGACKKHAAMGAFFLEAELADDLIVYLVEPEAKRALVRRIKKTQGAEQAGVEELSLVVRSTVGALLEGREIGMEQGPELAPKPAPKPAPVPAAPPPAPPRDAPAPRPRDQSRARLDAHYAGESYAPEVGWQNGLGVELSASMDGLLFFGLGYVASAPVEAERDAARVRIGRYPVRAFAGYEIPLDRLRFVGQLGLIGELDRRSTTKTAGGVAPTESDDQLGWAVSPRVGVRYDVGQRTSVGLTVGADVFLNVSEYVVDLPSGRETLLTPYRVRPRAALGIAVDLW